MAVAGSGFIRIPYPRRFNMPASEPVKDDAEKGEIYSLSVTHQLHCLVRLFFGGVFKKKIWKSYGLNDHVLGRSPARNYQVRKS